VLLLPYPRLRLPVSDVEGRRKLFKNLEYVSQTIFRLIIQGGENALDDYLGARGRLYMGGAVWVADQDGKLPAREPFWRVETVPHVTVDRVAQSSAYYQVGQVRFAPACGLYIVCREQETGAAAGLFELLQRLGDSGLGGRRSRGLGQFTVHMAPELNVSDVSDAQRLVLLSRYRPSPAELASGVLGTDASYQLASVGGWLQTSDITAAAQRRRNVRLLTEGSSFT